MAKLDDRLLTGQTIIDDDLPAILELAHKIWTSHGPFVLSEIAHQKYLKFPKIKQQIIFALEQEGFSCRKWDDIVRGATPEHKPQIWTNKDVFFKR